MTDALPARLDEIFPVLPLRSSIVFPREIAQLILALDDSGMLDSLTEGDHRIVVVGQRDRKADNPSLAQLYSIGTESAVLRFGQPLRRVGPHVARQGGVSAPMHVFEEHVGEVQIRIEAGNLADLFAEAGRALAELQLDAAVGNAPREIEDVIVRAPDREALLVEWLNELIFRSETRHCAFTAFDVTRISDGELQARIGGVGVLHPRVAVKAATMHGLRIEKQPGGLRATVVLDV